MKFRIVLLKLFFLGALFIISNSNLHLGDSSERQAFFDSYSSWLGKIFNQGLQVTAYVVKFEWLPDISNISLNDSLKTDNLSNQKAKK